MIKIEMGIGWKPDPERPGWLTTCFDSDYVAEIERLRTTLASAESENERLRNRIKTLQEVIGLRASATPPSSGEARLWQVIVRWFRRGADEGMPLPPTPSESPQPLVITSVPAYETTPPPIATPTISLNRAARRAEQKVDPVILRRMS